MMVSRHQSQPLGSNLRQQPCNLKGSNIRAAASVFWYNFLSSWGYALFLLEEAAIAKKKSVEPDVDKINKEKKEIKIELFCCQLTQAPESL